MTRLRFTVVALVAAVAALWLAGAGKAETFIIITIARGAPEAHVGDLIRADPGTPAVSKAKNPLNGASGTIELPNDRCADFSFHGKIAGHADPAPNGCGWGRVVVANSLLLEIGLAIEEEVEAIKLLKSSQLFEAIPKLEAAIPHLRAAKKELAGMGLTQRASDIARAIKDDQDATHPQSAQNSRELSFMEGLVQRALVDKRLCVNALPPTVVGLSPSTYAVFNVGAGGGTSVTDGGSVLGNNLNPATSVVQPFTWKSGALTPLPLPTGENGIGLTFTKDGIAGGYAAPTGGEHSAAIWSFLNGQEQFESLDGLTGATGKSNAVEACDDLKPKTCVGVSDVRLPSGLVQEDATAWKPEVLFQTLAASPRPAAIGDFPGASGALALNNKHIFGGSFFDGGSSGPYSPYIASLQTKKELVLWRPPGGSGVVLALDALTIAGGSITDAGGKHAELWWGAQHSTLGPKTMPSVIHAVNNRGWAIGDIGTPGHTSAALFIGKRTFDLSRTIPGYTLTRGDDLNNNGQLLVDGVNAQGQTHAFLLRPKTRRK